MGGLENAHPEAASVVVGDFNSANMRKVLPKYHQHINFPTRGDQTLDHCYSQLRNGYKPLLPAYRQQLKLEEPVHRAVQCLREEHKPPRNCFETSDCVPANGDIDEKQTMSQPTSQSALMMSSRGVNVRTFHNQGKGGVKGGVRAKLKARPSAYSSGDPEALRRAIRDAKRAYRDKLESNYHSFDLRCMWCGFQAISL